MGFREERKAEGEAQHHPKSESEDENNKIRDEVLSRSNLGSGKVGSMDEDGRYLVRRCERSCL
jgi:hypothetical protein